MFTKFMRETKFCRNLKKIVQKFFESLRKFQTNFVGILRSFYGNYEKFCCNLEEGFWKFYRISGEYF